jgi:hypothetical protein
MDTAEPFGAASNLFNHIIEFTLLIFLRLLTHWALINFTNPKYLF